MEGRLLSSYIDWGGGRIVDGCLWRGTQWAAVRLPLTETTQKYLCLVPDSNPDPTVWESQELNTSPDGRYRKFLLGQF